MKKYLFNQLRSNELKLEKRSRLEILKHAEDQLNSLNNLAGITAEDFFDKMKHNIIRSSLEDYLTQQVPLEINIKNILDKELLDDSDFHNLLFDFIIINNVLL